MRYMPADTVVVAFLSPPTISAPLLSCTYTGTAASPSALSKPQAPFLGCPVLSWAALCCCCCCMGVRILPLLVSVLLRRWWSCRGRRWRVVWGGGGSYPGTHTSQPAGRYTWRGLAKSQVSNGCQPNQLSQPCGVGGGCQKIMPWRAMARNDAVPNTVHRHKKLSDACSFPSSP